MLAKDQKALDILALNESEATELIEMADTYRKSFASKVKENEVNVFIQSLEEPTDEDVLKLLDMLKTLGVERDESELKQNIHTIINQQKMCKKQLDKLEEKFKEFFSLDMPEVDALDSFISDIKNKHLKLVDISADLKTANKKLKQIENNKPLSVGPEIQKEIDIFLKNFINPADDDIRDFIDFLDDRYEIPNKDGLVKLLKQKEKAFKSDQLFVSKIVLFKRSIEKLDTENNVMLQYRSIRNIYGLSKDNKELLKWMQTNHYDVLKQSVNKLLLMASSGTDDAVINESRLALNILEPFMKKSDKITPDELTCPDCGKSVNQEWKLCPNCGGNLSLDHCSNCGTKLESSWKLCPNCGKDVE